MKNWLYSENPLDIDDNTKNIILDNLPIKYRTDKYLNSVIVIVHRLSNLPWYTQEEVLSEINLNESNLTGEIPSCIGNLTNLTCLNLHSNQLQGSIPPEIGNLTNL